MKEEKGKKNKTLKIIREEKVAMEAQTMDMVDLLTIWEVMVEGVDPVVHVDMAVQENMNQILPDWLMFLSN